jgi:hypothetical protein
MLKWLLSLFGLVQKSEQTAAATAPSAAKAAKAKAAAAAAAKTQVAPVSSLTNVEFRAARALVITYVSRARIPTRQAAALRLLWIADLSKVYEAIRNSPTQLILERAGDVGQTHEPAFRDALSQAQSLEPPPQCEVAHDALVNWLTSLHSACLALIDARRLKDRSLLGTFREHLSQARRHAAALAAERSTLFTDYRLRVKPGLSRRRARPGTTEESTATTTGEEPAETSEAAQDEAPHQRKRPGRQRFKSNTATDERASTRPARPANAPRQRRRAPG